MKNCGALEIRLGIGFSMQNVAGSDEVMDVWPEAGSTQTDFSERPGGRGDHGKLGGRNRREQLLGTGKRDHIGDLFDFTLLHPAILRQVDGGIDMGKEFADGSQTGSAVREVDDVVGIQVVFARPAGPDAGDGGSGIDQDAIHIEEKTLAGDFSH